MTKEEVARRKNNIDVAISTGTYSIERAIEYIAVDPGVAIDMLRGSLGWFRSIAVELRELELAKIEGL